MRRKIITDNSAEKIEVISDIEHFALIHTKKYSGKPKIYVTLLNSRERKALKESLNEEEVEDASKEPIPKGA